MKNHNTHLSYSQAVSSLLNKKKRIPRKNGFINGNRNILLYCKPESLKRADAQTMHAKLSSLSSYYLGIAKFMIVKIQEAGSVLSGKSLEYFASSLGCSTKSINRTAKKLEEIGIIEVHQFFKETNHYVLSNEVRDKTMIYGLGDIFPSLRKMLPYLFSLSSLLSSNPSKKDSVRLNKEVIYINKENFKKSKNMKSENSHHDQWSSAFTGTGYDSPPKQPNTSPNVSLKQPSWSSEMRNLGSKPSWGSYNGPKHISCCEFRGMGSGMRIAYMHKYLITRKDSDRGWIPASERMQDMLLCRDTCKK